jgi:hypothetical protein
VIGTALGYAISAAIDAYREHKKLKQAKAEAWRQQLQDGLAGMALKCETEETPPDDRPGCRSDVFVLSQFFQRHCHEFVFDGHNLILVFKNLPSLGDWDSEKLEKAFQAIDKRKVDKKPYLGLSDEDRKWWVNAYSAFDANAGSSNIQPRQTY